jgi:hypothetical protein
MIPAEAVDSVHWSDMKMYLKNIDPPSKFTFWFGLTDARVKGTFEWYSSGRVANYFDWSRNEPKNVPPYSCVQIAASSNRYWGMHTCSSLSYAFCESGSKNYSFRDT